MVSLAPATDVNRADELSGAALLGAELERTRGRWLGYLYALAALLSVITLLVPHASGYDVIGLVVVTVVAAAVSVAVLVGNVASSVSVAHALTALATLLVTAVIHFTLGLPNAATIFYVWIVLFAFYFFEIRAAVLHLALVLALYVVSALTTNGPYPLVAHSVATIGTLIGAASIVGLLKRRIETLMGQQARSARTDELTGLPNRRAFNEDLDRALARAERAGEPLTLAILDLDHFKLVNDRYGHPAGDAVLRATAAALRDTVRASDLAARMGGEEFGLILSDASADGSRVLAERMRKAVARTEVAESGASVTASIGTATWNPGMARDATELVQRADRALYAAKEGGRDRVIAA